MKTEEKAEELYSYYDDLLARDLTLDTSITSGDITEFAKNCARRVCNESIKELESLKKMFNAHHIFIPPGLISSKLAYWFDVRKRIEEIRD